MPKRPPPGNYENPWPQLGLMSIKSYRGPKVQRACVVGKGPSVDQWRNVAADVYLTINEAAYVVDRACYAVRGDGNTENHRFLEWLPPYVTPIMPLRLKEYYNYGYYFSWSDLGLDTICLTTLMAIRLAYRMFGAESIVCVGLDALHTPVRTYHPDLANPRNLARGLGDQRPRVKLLEPEIYSRCRHHNGDPLVIEYLL